jgi:hypothetical protein
MAQFEQEPAGQVYSKRLRAVSPGSLTRLKRRYSALLLPPRSRVSAGKPQQPNSACLRWTTSPDEQRRQLLIKISSEKPEPLT